MKNTKRTIVPYPILTIGARGPAKAILARLSKSDRVSYSLDSDLRPHDPDWVRSTPVWRSLLAKVVALA